MCQEVCPFNASPKPRPGDAALAPLNHLQFPLLEDLISLRSGQYRRFVKQTALTRTSRAQLARNAAVALGNAHNRNAIPILVRALTDNTYPLVRGHAAWALGRYPSSEVLKTLRNCLKRESDTYVIGEIRAALDELEANLPPKPENPLPKSNNRDR